MRRDSAVLLLALVTLSTSALAAPPKAYVDAFIVTDAQVDPDDRKGDGYGVKGALSLSGPWFLTGEYQDVEYDDLVGDFDGDTQDDRIGSELSQYRVGLGYRAPVGASTQAFVQGEYVGVESEVDATLSDGGSPVSGSASLDDEGYGVHAGLRGENGRLGVTAQIGFLDVADYDGAEYGIEADFRFSSWLGAFVGYRVTDLSHDRDGDLKLKDFRAGLTAYFGG